MTLYSNVPIIGSGALPKDYNTTELGLHACELTQRSDVGRRAITDDGRAYRYCKATTGGVDAYHGANGLADEVIAEVITTTSPSAAAAIGTRETYITQTGFVEDELVGAYIFIYATIGGQLRRVVHNDKSLTSKTRIVVDEPWDQTIAGTEYTDMFENPWSLCTKTATNAASIVCVPACTAAASYYFWGQVKGPCVVSPGEAITGTTEVRQVVFGANGAVFEEASHSDWQHAGWIMNKGTPYGPLIMLEIE